MQIKTIEWEYEEAPVDIHLLTSEDVEPSSDFLLVLDPIAISPDVVGSKYMDSDQLFHQMGFSGEKVGRVINTQTGLVLDLVLRGEQRVYALFGDKGNGEIYPYDHYVEGDIHKDGSVIEEVRLLNDPDMLLRAEKLEKETGLTYLNYQDNCWIEIEFTSFDGKAVSLSDLGILDVCDSLKTSFCHIEDSLYEIESGVRLYNLDVISEEKTALNDMEAVLLQMNLPVTKDTKGQSLFIGDRVSLVFNGKEEEGTVVYKKEHGQFKIYIPRTDQYGRFGHGEITSIEKIF